MRKLRCVTMCALVAAPLCAQQAGSGARDVYYRGLASREAYYDFSKSTPKQKKGGSARKGTPKGSGQQEKGVLPESGGTPGTPMAGNTASVVPAALEFAVRYNLLKVNPETDTSIEVDPDANYATGDCFAVRFTPNHSGRLFVFNRASSGKWQPLLPSSDAPDEKVTVAAAVPITVPQKHCFLIEEPKGVENLVVVVAPAELVAKAEPPSVTAGRMADEIGKGTLLAGRDLRVEKIKKPQRADEPPNSVYVFNPNPAKDGSMMIELKIRHE